jgi:predicted GTPase
MGEPLTSSRHEEGAPFPISQPGGADDLPTKINNVLRLRKPYAEWLRNAKTYLGQLQGEIEGLERLKGEMADDPVFKPYVDELPFAGLANRTEELRRKLGDLGQRLERQTLNVAVVGMVNQGKSFLLRTLSGLPQSVIPNRGREHDQLAPLTGARSNIIHEQGARVRGRITFYSLLSL